MNTILLQIDRVNRKSVKFIPSDMQNYYIVLAPEYVPNSQIKDMFCLFNTMANYDDIHIIPKRESKNFSKIGIHLSYYIEVLIGSSFKT